MKFGKRLKQHVEETLPGWEDKFLLYKDLKKLMRLKSLAPAMLNGSEETEFVYLLNSEIDKFNDFFMEQEEDFVIYHKELQQRIQIVINTWGPNGDEPSETHYMEEMTKLKKYIVDFHGEMVLLINYSNINYTGLGKILKKYDKRTGGLLRLPYIQKVLQQPFFITDVISKLVKECENTINSVFPPTCDEGISIRQRRGGTEERGRSSGIYRKTVAALVTMQEIRKGSSTYGHFSLPPLNLNESHVIHSLQLNSAIVIP